MRIRVAECPAGCGDAVSVLGEREPKPCMACRLKEVTARAVAAEAEVRRVTAERDEARGQRDNYCSRWLRAGFDRDTWKHVAEKGTEATKVVAAQRDKARKELECVTAERDAERAEHTRWVLKNAVDAHELKQARREVAAMEAACVEIFADDYVVVIGSKADIEALTRSRVLDALKKARGE